MKKQSRLAKFSVPLSLLALTLVITAATYALMNRDQARGFEQNQFFNDAGFENWRN